MRKVTVKVLTIAAAAVAPHLIAVDAKVTQLKHIEKLSVDQRAAVKDLSEKAVYDADYDKGKNPIT